MSFPISSGTEGPLSDPFGLDEFSAHKKAPLIVSATKVSPKPGDLF